MKRAISILAAIAFCAGMNATLAADMFSGNWKLNLAKSKFDPGPAPKGPNFSKIEATNNPVKGDPNRDTAALKKINDNTIEIVNKRDGKVTTTTRVVFSNDGKTRTQTTTGTNAKGEKVNSSVVYEK
jgi:hypothetical protein